MNKEQVGEKRVHDVDEKMTEVSYEASPGETWKGVHNVPSFHRRAGSKVERLAIDDSVVRKLKALHTPVVLVSSWKVYVYDPILHTDILQTQVPFGCMRIRYVILKEMNKLTKEVRYVCETFSK
jgi:hypothetical protein